MPFGIRAVIHASWSLGGSLGSCHLTQGLKSEGVGVLVCVCLFVWVSQVAVDTGLPRIGDEVGRGREGGTKTTGASKLRRPRVDCHCARSFYVGQHHPSTATSESTGYGRGDVQLSWTGLALQALAKRFDKFKTARRRSSMRAPSGGGGRWSGFGVMGARLGTRQCSRTT